jgi:hypothetical protein
MYIVTSYWIEGEMGETIKTKEFTSASRAEYYHKENGINDLCTYSTLSKMSLKNNIIAKEDCSYCNA